MRLFRHFEETPETARGGVIALGNFDGMHLGHRAVIERARAAGRAKNMPWGVMTFEPHPRAVLRAVDEPFRLTPMRAKARLIEEMGADFLLMQQFDRTFAAHTAQDFVVQVLVGALAVKQVVVGYDFVFGHGRVGNTALLERYAGEFGFGFEALAPVSGPEGEPYSSTRVREALAAGKPREAARILGREWEIEGRVERGHGRGRAMNFPTANVTPGESLRPAAGVYAVRALIGEEKPSRWHAGVAYIGPRPTFGESEVLLETHLFDFSGDLYGRHMRVALVEHLRGDKRFADVTELTRQMDDDGRAARRILAAAPMAEVRP